MSAKPRCLPAAKAKAGVPAIKVCCCPRGIVRGATGGSIRAAQSVGVLVGVVREGCVVSLMLRFILRRSATLRTYAGDTSLPGGKVDPDDKSIEDTAVSYLVVLQLWFAAYL